MSGIIKIGATEWMQDKWDTSATMESNVNPVCIKKHSSYYVLRSKVGERTSGHEEIIIVLDWFL